MDDREETEGQATGRESPHAQESWVSGPYGALELSSTRFAEANEGSASAKHPLRTALIFVGIVVLLVVAVTLVLIYA